MNRFPLPSLITIFSLILGSVFLTPGQSQAQDLEELYYKASEQAQQGNFEEALKVYTQIVTDFGEYAWEDYGPVFGGVYYDKGICHLQLKQYAEAKEAFKTCHEMFPNKPNEHRKEMSKVTSTNMRWELAVFQWGYCEQQAENYQAALDLYDKFISLNPDPSILKSIHAAYILRRGVCLIGTGQITQGEAELTKLFADFEKYSASGQLLFQAMLELGQGWIQLSKTDPDSARQSANSFLDQYGNLFSISPYDKARLGFVDRLRFIGYEAQQAGLNVVALRFFSMVPTTHDILNDLKTRAAQTGGAARATYDEVIAQYEEVLTKPDPPELETLRLIAACWEGLGNRRSGYVINRHLIDNYPDSEALPQIIHEAARYAFALGDASAAQYHGEQFMAQFPEHELRDNVAAFMLQSLFRNQKYEVCLDVSENVRAKFEVGAPQRELADFIYGASLYYLNRQEEAKEALDLHVSNYPDSGNLESSRFFQASTRMILGEYAEAAPLLDAYIKDYPEAPFLDQVLLDRATCYYIENDFVSTLQRLDRLFEEYPNSNILDRGYLLKGDTHRALASTPEEGKEDSEYQAEAKEAYLAAKDAAERLEHPDTRAEALFKLVDVSIELEQFDDAVAYYDAFFPDHAGSFWEPQISVFAMPALAAKERTEDGLAQLEKMIQDLSEDEERSDLLQQAIGSYQTHSVEHRGPEATIAKYDEMAENANNFLKTWLMIHKIMVYEEMRSQIKDKESPEVATINDKIDQVFKTLTQFELDLLSDAALQAIGKHFEDDNPQRARIYFEELLLREDDTFKAPAEMAIGRIEMRSNDPSEVSNAIQRFKRVITEYKDPKYDAEELIPEAHVNIGRTAIKREDWAEAEEYLGTYINNKKWDAGRRERRAEAQYLYAFSLEKQGQIDEAVKVYNAVFATYAAYPEWAARAVERGFEISYNKKMPTPQLTREQKIKAYSYLRRVLYSWQKIEDGEFEALDRLRRRRDEVEIDLGLSQQEIEDLEFELGISDQN